MPSQSHYDDLPSYQRIQLRRMAAAIIRSMPRARRRIEERLRQQPQPES